MKRVLSLICVVAILLGAMALTAFASPKDDILSAVKESVPADILERYQTQGVNMLNQIDVTQEQAEQVIAYIKQAGPLLKAGTVSGHQYTPAERQTLVGLFDSICATLHLTYNITTKATGLHQNDIIIHVYYNGKIVGDLDGDFVKQTGGTATDTTENLAVIVSVLALLTVASAVIAAKRISAHRA